MASTLAAAASRRVVHLSGAYSPGLSLGSRHLIQRRGLAGAADHHGPPRVNFWEDPMSPSKWKEEHVSPIPLLSIMVY
ncbi:hypothetical protein SAY86_024125 [Trapa natans]|uniref:Uncharacterized protein n=1 Tax=Trapa natans TaxID=22666 RepID=A0AAN7MBU9_TRANT|nr:hypothetical protein SAY86_024125 [Trapa natans]